MACVYNVEDAADAHMVEEADVVEGCRAIGFTLGIPAVGMVGVVDDVLADRAFVEGRDRNAAELAQVADVPTGARTTSRTRWRPPRSPAPTASPPARSVAACKAFTLDRAPDRDGRRPIDGVGYVDDSKATNPHAATASLSAFESVVWVAGGLAKGASFDELVAAVRDRLRAAVLLGADRDVIAAALARHAPDVPVIDGAGHRHWCDGARRRRCGLGRRQPATRCCWRRRARPRTCSPTTRPAATRSSRRFARLARALTRPPAARRTDSEKGRRGDRERARRWTRQRAADGFLASLKRALDKPLTSYHLVLGVPALLLSLGLLMVLSASSVTRCSEFGNSYAIFIRRRSGWPSGVPLAWVASRLPLEADPLPRLAGAAGVVRR